MFPRLTNTTKNLVEKKRERSTSSKRLVRRRHNRVVSVSENEFEDISDLEHQNKSKRKKVEAKCFIDDEAAEGGSDSSNDNESDNEHNLICDEEMDDDDMDTMSYVAT